MLIEPGFGIEEATLTFSWVDALIERQTVGAHVAEAGAEVDVTQLVDIARATRNEGVFRLAQVESDVPSVRYGASLRPPAQTAPPGRRICLGLAAFVAVRTGARAPLRLLSLTTILSEHAATYERIRKADTVGAFQIESRAQMSMLPRMAPKRSTILLSRLLASGPGLSRRYGASLSAPEGSKEPSNSRSRSWWGTEFSLGPGRVDGERKGVGHQGLRRCVLHEGVATQCRRFPGGARTITRVTARQEPLPTSSVVHVSADREVREVPNGGAYGERTQKA